MERDNFININDIEESCFILTLEYDVRLFPIDARIKKSNKSMNKDLNGGETIIGKRISDVLGKTPSFSYMLKLIDYVVRSGKTKSLIDYWNIIGYEVEIDCFKICEKDCLVIVRNKRPMREEEFLLTQQNEKMKLKMIGNNDFFISTFSFNIGNGEDITFAHAPNDLCLDEYLQDPKEFFLKKLLHPDDLARFNSKFKATTILAETENGGEWNCEIRRKCGKDYRYVNCVIKKSIVKDNLYFGWEYDTTSEHIMLESQKKKNNFYNIYANALEAAGKKFYAIYGVEVLTNSIFVIEKKEEFKAILYEDIIGDKKKIRVSEDYIHPDDYKKIEDFFDIKRLDKTLTNIDDKQSIKFRRIIDWTYQWVKVTASKFGSSEERYILFTFENIDEEIQKELVMRELLSIMKSEYRINIFVDLDTMDYRCCWKNKTYVKIEEEGLYSDLYQSAIQCVDIEYRRSFSDLFEASNIVNNYDNNKKRRLKTKILTIDGIKYVNIELIYGGEENRKSAYILINDEIDK